MANFGWFSPAFPLLFLNAFLKKRFGRDNFQEAQKIAGRADPTKIDWTKFKYMVYDIPSHRGTYAERYVALGNLNSSLFWT